TMTTATTVSGANQDLGGGTLTVASTSNFESGAGKFAVDGIDGTCSYTSTSGGNTFNGVSGCTGKPKDGASVTRITKAPGVYKWDDSSHDWQFQIVGIPTGDTMPTTPATGDYFQLTKAMT